MGRTRANLLDSALVCIEKYGARKTTMADIATRGRLAKATLYNHVRTKDDLYAAAVEAEVAKVVDAALTTTADAGLSAALAEAATTVSAHKPLRRVAKDEPALLARLVTAGSGPAWETAVEGARAVLDRAGRDASAAAATTVVRWVLSHVGVPATPDEAAVGATVLTSGLAPARGPGQESHSGGLDPTAPGGED